MGSEFGCDDGEFCIAGHDLGGFAIGFGDEIADFDFADFACEFGPIGGSVEGFDGGKGRSPLKEGFPEGFDADTDRADGAEACNDNTRAHGRWYGGFRGMERRREWGLGSRSGDHLCRSGSSIGLFGNKGTYE